MSVWQFSAAIDGWVDANSPPGGISQKEQDEIWAWMMAKEGLPN